MGKLRLGEEVYMISAPGVRHRAGARTSQDLRC